MKRKKRTERIRESERGVQILCSSAFGDVLQGAALDEKHLHGLATLRKHVARNTEATGKAVAKAFAWIVMHKER
jgi:hypothetical protein